jgi:hypothetical protein
MLKFTPTEIKHLIIGILIMGFVFGFNDGRETFVLGYWLLNILRYIILAAIVILVHTMGHKIIASRYNIFTTFQILGFKRYWITKSAGFPRDINIGIKKFTIKNFYIGPVITLLVTIFSNGKLFFVPLEMYLMKTKKIRRVGYEFTAVTHYENAKIAFSGILANVVLSMILQIFNTTGIFDKLIFMNLVFAMYCILPLPHLDGIKIFMGSKPLYLFSFFLVLFSLLFLKSLFPIYSLFLILAASILSAIAYIYLRVYR